MIGVTIINNTNILHQYHFYIMSNEQTIFFSVDTRLLNQLGEKLVTKRAVALAELVKNSYDADATHVTIRLLNITKPGGTIIVEDNGSGMSLSQFKETWMRIATIDKEQNPISKIYKRESRGKRDRAFCMSTIIK